jgi:hypothetical protein
LTNVIPVVKNYIKTQIPNEQVLLNRNLNCTDLGNSVIALQDGVCTRLMEGLDSVWFSYAVLGITAFISMPAMIYVANTLLAFTFGETQGKGYEVV